MSPPGLLLILTNTPSTPFWISRSYQVFPWKQYFMTYMFFTLCLISKIHFYILINLTTRAINCTNINLSIFLIFTPAEARRRWSSDEHHDPCVHRDTIRLILLIISVIVSLENLHYISMSIFIFIFKWSVSNSILVSLKLRSQSYIWKDEVRG